MDLDGRSNALRHNSPLFTKWRSKAENYHEKIPYLRSLPGPAIAIILFVAAVNVLVWVACGIVLSFHPGLVTTAVLSYTLGLRHALDADHITAIDLMTRRLLASGQRPVTVGTFFSLGHSTVVIVTSIVVAASSAAISKRFDAFSEVGSIIGTSISAAFLILLGIMNGYIFYKLYQQLQRAIAAPIGQESLEFNFEGAGCMMAVLRKLFKIVDRPWKMYPLGVVFGLGFDTSSEIALLGISSIQGSQGTSIWLILIFPVLFTAGMCLLDTFVIGIIQLMNLILNVKPGLTGPFWHGVEVAADHYDIIGGSICGSFIVFGALAVVLYRPWRRRIDRKRLESATLTDADEQVDDSDAVDEYGPKRDAEEDVGDSMHKFTTSGDNDKSRPRSGISDIGESSWE
ncbi:hypothetical protein LTR37_015036 [Vermiconidia calcicola]|uniref:Uncharacterized protein n=1 Tax=Vermiconidia calcicola TaxID=1690605 RepID=A0ACC3MSX6_9PEZI|nr:hypothetical protein LTR37_015036 [Vermiconidia calcicola]